MASEVRRLPPSDVLRELGSLFGASAHDRHVYCVYGNYERLPPFAARLRKEIAELDKELARVNGRLSNEQFLSRAPAEVVEKERGIQRDLTEKRTALVQRLSVFGGG